MICINNYNQSLNYDLYSKYTALGGFTERIFLYNQSFNNNTYNLSVGNYNDTISTSVLNLALKDSSYLSYSNIVVHLDRYYVSDNLWRTVQYDLSDDYGRTIFNVREKDTDYRLSFYDQNDNLLKTSNTIKFLCIAGLCDLAYIINPIDSSVTNNLTYQYFYNNVTQILQVNWSDVTKKTTSLRILISQELFQRSVVICNNTVYNYTGSMNCDTSGYNGTIAVRFYSTASPEKNIITFFLTKVDKVLKDILGTREVSFWGGLIIVMIAGFGAIISPVVSIALAIFGMIALFMLGITSFISITLLILIIIIGIILAVKVKI
jgi:hypothetical protein